MSADGLIQKIEALRVVPVAVIDDAATAAPLADALVAGGLPCLEITLRTPEAEAAIRAIAGRRDILVGAGTVVTPEHVDRAAQAGASFVVSPGLSIDVVRRAEELGLPAIPGIATASDVQAAVRAGLHAVKLFPADILGGLGILDALAAPFPDMRFMPSGGINAANAADYLVHPAVFAVSGSWMIPRALIAERDFDQIRRRVTHTVLPLVKTERSLAG
jgi:2-dehydro-3-deoxyphosphogluconate aldolase / (4S)-4-hydroxy-2-oxoglutarate aldolase